MPVPLNELELMRRIAAASLAYFRALRLFYAAAADSAEEGKHYVAALTAYRDLKESTIAFSRLKGETWPDE